MIYAYCTIVATLVALLAPGCTAEDSNLGITVLHMPKNCARKSIVGDIISVVYIVMLTDGTIVEDLRSDDEPFEFRIGSRQAIAGLDIGLRDVCVGERLRLRVPSRLAHGSKGFESLVPANATLIYELEVKRIRKYSNLFDEIDSNRNGFLSKDEFRRYLMMREREIRDIPDAEALSSDEEFDPEDNTWMFEDDEEEQVEVTDMLKEIFKVIDENGDGVLAEDEFFRKNAGDLDGLDFDLKEAQRSAKEKTKKAGKKSDVPRTAQRSDASSAEAEARANVEKDNRNEQVNATASSATSAKPQGQEVKQEL